MRVSWKVAHSGLRADCPLAGLSGSVGFLEPNVLWKYYLLHFYSYLLN